MRGSLVRATVLWIAGLLTLVPYATYHLLFRAPREQYALLITFVLFWVFGYWGVVGPFLAALKARRVFRAIEQTRSNEELMAALRSPETREVAIDIIASENHIPRIIATRVYNLLAERLLPSGTAGAASSKGSPTRPGAR
jgi:hypothetical protein